MTFLSSKRKSFISSFVILILPLLFFSSCQGRSLSDIGVMTYNVENLFDTLHDEGKRDWEYLPKEFAGKENNCKKIRKKRYRNNCLRSDWTPSRLKVKLSQIKKVISFDGLKKPDFLALEEVENENVVKLLAKELGYSHWVVSQSPDRRGIDLAILYEESPFLKRVGVFEHELEGGYFKKRPTRNILESHFMINGKYPLTIFVNHWPSQGNPTEARISAAKKLKSLVEKRLKDQPKGAILAVGDFNILPYENPHPVKNILLSSNSLYDVHDLFMSDSSISKKDKNKVPLGTYFYPPKREWNRFDRIFVSDTLLSKGEKKKGLFLDLPEYKIYNPDFITTSLKLRKKYSEGSSSIIKGVPFRYNFLADRSNKAGFSDHFPVFVKLKIKD